MASSYIYALHITFYASRLFTVQILLLEPLELGVGGREIMRARIGAGGHKVQVWRLRGVGARGGPQCGQARAADRAGRQARMYTRVVGVGVGVDLVDRQRVELGPPVARLAERIL